MFWLFAASVIWAFSFGLIKGMVPHADPLLLSAVRLGFAFFAVVWLFRPGSVPKNAALRASLAGFVQLGMMYAPYMSSFQYLKAHEVALFTMTSPLYVALLDQVARRRVSGRILGASLLAVLGGGIVAWKQIESERIFEGFILVQASNFLFALGQMIWVKNSKNTVQIFWRMIPYYFFGAMVGAFLFAGVYAAAPWESLLGLSSLNWAILLWLGIVSSGVGFIIWNFGATRVSMAQLAVAADVKLPIAVLVSLLFFGEPADVLRLSLSFLVLSVAAWLAKFKD